MWFEIVNTLIAAAGLGLASMPFLKIRPENTKRSKDQMAKKAVSFTEEFGLIRSTHRFTNERVGS
ncbi:hypothetical protein [uncultured Roseobacter sp.]|uniref:hypothetical protein n=1 Tax=uncultured Roseobacter sp. TaxID=114847 RepID=UPI002624DF90|nr:hypothetical protein [uncultured Roseobacter sp.]